jgi:hypothetical protein
MQDERVDDAAIHGPVMLRGATLVGCPVLGVLQPGDDAIYICYVGGTADMWTYLRDVRTGVQGWAPDHLLRYNGSDTYCGF